MPYYETVWFEWVAITLCVAVGLVLVQVLDGGASYAGLHYLELAQSLVQGKGLTVSTVQPHYAYSTPPLYPALLAGLLKLGKHKQYVDGFKLFHIVNWVLYGFSAFLAQFYLRKTLPKPTALVITALYTLSPVTLVAAASLNANITFMVFLMLSILTIDNVFGHPEAPPTQWGLTQCCLWLVLAILTKNIGYIAFGAFLLVALRRLGTRNTLVMGLTILLCLSPFIVREMLARSERPEVMAAATANEIRVVSPFANSKGFYKQTVENVKTAMVDSTAGTLGNLSFRSFDGLLFRKLYINQFDFKLTDLMWVRVALGLLLALGAYTAMAFFSGITAWYMAVFLVATCLLPVEKTNLLLPILPFLLYHLYLGVMRLGLWFEQINVPLNRFALPVLSLLILLNNLNGYFQNIRETRLTTGYTAMASQSSAGNGNAPVALIANANASGPQPSEDLSALSASEQAYVGGLRWITANTGQQEVVITRRPNATYRSTGRPVKDFPRAFTTKGLYRAFKQGNYIIEEVGIKGLHNRIAKVQARYPNAFSQVYADPTDGSVVIWRVN
jgi:hypothetical protein